MRHPSKRPRMWLFSCAVELGGLPGLAWLAISHMACKAWADLSWEL
jgi:hypothetical protein